MSDAAGSREEILDERVRLVVRDGIARVTLMRPDKHNAMDFRMLDAMIAVQKRLARATDVRVVLIDGEGPSFCAGLDVKSVFASRRDKLIGYLRLWWPWRNVFQRWSTGWRDLPYPVIAIVQGNCFGAGIQLALGADVRIATPDARFSIMEAKWGLVPDMGGTVLLRDLLRLDEAKLLTWTGRIFAAEEAHALGLVSDVAEDANAAALALAEKLMAQSPDALAAGKFLLQSAWQGSEWSALRAERIRQRQMLTSPNQTVAVRRNTGKPDEPWRPLRTRR